MIPGPGTTSVPARVHPGWCRTGLRISSRWEKSQISIRATTRFGRKSASWISACVILVNTRWRWPLSPEPVVSFGHVFLWNVANSADWLWGEKLASSLRTRRKHASTLQNYLSSRPGIQLSLVRLPLRKKLNSTQLLYEQMWQKRDGYG